MKIKTIGGVLAITGLLSAGVVQAQKVKIDSSYNNTYYKGRMELFSTLPQIKKSIVFLGNSITERGMWHELLPGKLIVNRGIGGDNTFGVLARIRPIIASQPQKVFLLIGINDIGRGLPVEVIADNYEEIIQRFQKGSPKTTLYVQSVLPMNEDILSAAYLKNKGHLVIELNTKLKALAAKYDLNYLNIYDVFNEGNNKLKPEFTIDGIHLKPAAYAVWVEYLKTNKYL
ncbi:GDSL-type esterase/lipase family protein [Pedobacter immunditicola]|uniref:GDSL-type esterase/lipase family protein n=1 Tax=Pedobacter immunditicola TaxID=3133440 RepID=UPI0030B09415